MFCLKGYNRLLKKWIEMKILDDGTVLADDWEHIEEDSIKRYTEQMDMGKKMLWEDDQIVDMQTGKCMIIRFGEYETYCVEEEQVMKSVGFYLETRNGEKKVKKLIDQRCRYAEMVEKVDYELSTWLEKNKINVDEQDVFGGSEVYHNPIGSANRIRKEILEK